MANEEHGMDINAGIVFIPKEAEVGRHTGSRYELDENRKPIVNQDFLNALQAFSDSPGFASFSSEIMEVTGKGTAGSLGDPEKLAPFRTRLEREFGMKDKHLQDAAMNYQALFSLKVNKDSLATSGKPESKLYWEKEIASTLGLALKREGIYYREAGDKVASEDYWEEYFKEHPEQRPSKVVYYKGNDPTRALGEWKKANGIRKKSESGSEKHLGFAENRFDEKISIYQEKSSRFRSIAEAVIREYYAGKSKPRENEEPNKPE